MASQVREEDSDDGMDEFMEKFKTHKYKNAFSENNWEEEFDKVPMFMKSAPEDIDPVKHPDLACLQSIIHDDDRPPEGNMRSALNDATAARKLKPGHIKAVIRGAQCCMELCNYADALQWCDEGLRVQPTDKKLLELRATADKQKRAAERDARKAKAKARKQQNERGALLAAIKERGIRLLKAEKGDHRGSDSEEEDADHGSTSAMAELSLDGLSSQEATGAQVYLDEQGALHWPVLFLYPEHRQTDFISAFCENSSFIDHLVLMFGEELPPWDTDKKYQPTNLKLFFEDHKNGHLYEVALETSLLDVLQSPGCSVKAGTPSFIIMVKGSLFCKQFLSGKKVHRLE
ncbi:tetratricopeptide repeat protein 4 isoform X2 [Tachysurus vachellii]|uniref:tetratricopeptide repeat protein 4 isoform X2 n=1 Tax=Tachysurus vachellii TaxID=175792 RepID=UPI00296B3201|nr:tetratricopeptide repeat protein 4 isoform X2 [Tachysurus vachellii]